MLRGLFHVVKCNVRRTLLKPVPSALQYPHLSQSASGDVLPLTAKTDLVTVPDGEIKNEDKPKAFNAFAVMDLLLEKFDDDLLYLPDVMDEDEWKDLLDYGGFVEDNLKSKDDLLSDKISDGFREHMRKLKLFKLTIPGEYGGLGYNETQKNYIHEILSKFPSTRRILSENEDMGVKLIIKYGTDEQKQKYLPKLASGETMVSFAFLEESSSSMDSRSYRNLSATAVENGFLLNGEKCWVSNANSADFFLVFATQHVTDDEGVLMMPVILIVDKNTEGLIVNKPMQKKWLPGLKICDVVFHDVFVGNDSVLGQYGKGFDMLKNIIIENRRSSVAECSAQMKRLLHDAVDKCNNNAFYNQQLSSFQYTNVLIGEMATIAYATESVAFYLTSRYDYYDCPNLGIENFIAKIFAYESLPEVLQLYFNVTGKHGYQRGSFVEEIVQNAHFNAALDETTFDMKLLVISECLKYIGNKLSTEISQLRQPLDHPVQKLKQLWHVKQHDIDRPKPKLNLAACVARPLSDTMNDIEYCISRLNYCAKRHLEIHGSNALKEDNCAILICDMLIHIYASIACVARASKAINLTFRNSYENATLAMAFTTKALTRVKDISNLIGRNYEELDRYSEIGRKMFTKKCYDIEHPLMRSF